MVKNYWHKRFKKELVEEEDKLKQEADAAVKKKLVSNPESFFIDLIDSIGILDLIVNTVITAPEPPAQKQKSSSGGNNGAVTPPPRSQGLRWCFVF